MCPALPLATAEEALTLVPLPVYRRLSGDDASSDEAAVAAITDGYRLVEEYLGRKLLRAEHTETLPIRGGRVYPTHTPITDALDHVVSGAAFVMDPPDPFLGIDPVATVIYEGGFDPENFPASIARAIADVASAQVSVGLNSTQGGMTSAAVGDVKVTYDTGVDVTALMTPLALKVLRGYRKRRL